MLDKITNKDSSKHKWKKNEEGWEITQLRKRKSSLGCRSEYTWLRSYRIEIKTDAWCLQNTIASIFIFEEMKTIRRPDVSDSSQLV